jgi:hypothetical protein
MAISSSTQNLSASGQRVVAFFRTTDNAYRAVSDLKDAGFTSEEIGVISRSDHHTAGASARTGSATKDESFWDKLKNFFSGDSSEEDVEYRDASSGMNWDESRANYYYRGIGQGGALVSVTGARSQEARQILEKAGSRVRRLVGTPQWRAQRVLRAAGITASSFAAKRCAPIANEYSVARYVCARRL